MGRDFALLLGLGSVGYGLWLLFPPLTFLFAGGTVIFAVYRSNREHGGQ